MRIDLKLQLFHSNTFIKNLKLLQFTIISMTLTILAIVYLFFAVFHLLTNLSLIFKKLLDFLQDWCFLGRQAKILFSFKNVCTFDIHIYIYQNLTQCLSE